jgi:SpoVK/Ycf46/Vps4 family AAA+-type ATPase
MNKAVAEIATFWDRKDHYKKLGLMQSRGIIMYGPPGSGKSLALQQVGEAMAKKGDIMLMANSPDQISGALSAVRQIEPERRIVVAFEEADELASYDERTLLRLMDGDLKVDRVCYLATTNYIDRLSPRLQRPGRFDKRIYVGPPKFEHRLKYLNHKLKGIAEDSAIQDMAKKTEGLSFGHLRELIAGAFAIGDPVDEVIMRLRDSRNIKESRKSGAVNRIIG